MISFFFVEPIFETEEFTDLVDYILNPVPNPPCKKMFVDFAFFFIYYFFSGNSSGDIWEFIEFVDQPNQSDTSSGNFIVQNNHSFIILFTSNRLVE